MPNSVRSFIVSCVIGVGVVPATVIATEISVFNSAGDPTCLPTQCSSINVNQTTTLPFLAGTAVAGQASSSSYANIATGLMGAYATSAPFIPYFQGVADGSAQIIETIHIQGEVLAPVNGVLSIALHGSLTPNSAYESATGGAASAAATLQVDINGVAPGFALYSYQTSGCPPGGIVGSGSSAQSCINTTSISTVILVPFLISQTNQSFQFYIALNAVSMGGGTADISHTAGLGITLPNGLTFASDSGVFLTQSPVPEPASHALLLAGLGVAALFARRRRMNSRSR